MPTVLAKKYRLPKPQTDFEIMTVCPVCWLGCQAFLVANTRKVDGAKTGLQFGEDDPVRSDFLRRWHIDGIHICDVCKRQVKTCAARKARHARRIEEQEREVADARQYVTDELLNAWKSAEGEEKKRLQKEGGDAERRFRVAERRLAKMKDRGPCRPPKLKKLPTWWTNEVAPAPKPAAKILKKKTMPPAASVSSPLMQQYQDAKSKHPDMLLLFRMGDFYEAFDADARTLAKTIGLTITTRDRTTDMAGFPHHQLETYLHKLLAAGHRVAICDQVDSADGKSVERTVTTRECESVASPAVAPAARSAAAGVPSAAYCDGGVIGSNPSSVGGTWAVVLLDATGKWECLTASGVVTPEQVEGRPPITNNYTELLAAVEAMERLPAGWTGTLYTDSNVTRCRIVNLHPSMVGIPEALQQRLKAAKARLGWMSGKDHVTLLNGHPTKAELAAGVGKRGLPTSKWNVLCDKMCGDEAKRFVEENK